MPSLKPIPAGLFKGNDSHLRCWWCEKDSDYRDYHDHEWGYPVADDTRLFEKICLEGFQAGLSWLTILRKRETFRKAFKGFDMDKVSRFKEKDVLRLLQDPGIIRHRGKIEATINNAQRAKEMRGEFGSLAAYFWRYEPTPKERPARVTHASVSQLAKTAASESLSKDLRHRGWKFVGPTTAYAFMQAMGVVNDHLESCWVRDAALTARAKFDSPAKPDCDR
ncbi:MAG: DNA-3-methyladenine glycosylase I [Burkholderiaceae bacterium]